MAIRPAKELLYDSEASLRLVSNAIGELGAGASSADAVNPTALAQLPETLLRAYGEITSVLERLRESRGVLEHGAVEELSRMNAKLSEVSSATELAANDILDGLDRTVGMVEELDALAGRPDAAARGVEIRARMREELFGLTVTLQFQDITTQQLAYASSVIGEMEQRLTQVVALFDTRVLGVDSPSPSTPSTLHVKFDPHATTTSSADRQALADEIFTLTGR
jgi:chemotaxis regulatin CheY-phosphate phosphatase CheZ